MKCHRSPVGAPDEHRAGDRIDGFVPADDTATHLLTLHESELYDDGHQSVGHVRRSNPTERPSP